MKLYLNFATVCLAIGIFGFLFPKPVFSQDYGYQQVEKTVIILQDHDDYVQPQQIYVLPQRRVRTGNLYYPRPYFQQRQYLYPYQDYGYNNGGLTIVPSINYTIPIDRGNGGFVQFGFSGY
jgi:hypothetical protein